MDSCSIQPQPTVRREEKIHILVARTGVPSPNMTTTSLYIPSSNPISSLQNSLNPKSPTLQPLFPPSFQNSYATFAARFIAFEGSFVTRSTSFSSAKRWVAKIWELWWTNWQRQCYGARVRAETPITQYLGSDLNSVPFWVEEFPQGPFFFVLSYDEDMHLS